MIGKVDAQKPPLFPIEGKTKILAVTLTASALAIGLAIGVIEAVSGGVSTALAVLGPFLIANPVVPLIIGGTILLLVVLAVVYVTAFSTHAVAERAKNKLENGVSLKEHEVDALRKTLVSKAKHGEFDALLKIAQKAGRDTFSLFCDEDEDNESVLALAFAAHRVDFIDLVEENTPINNILAKQLRTSLQRDERGELTPSSEEFFLTLSLKNFSIFKGFFIWHISHSQEDKSLELRSIMGQFSNNMTRGEWKNTLSQMDLRGELTEILNAY